MFIDAVTERTQYGHCCTRTGGRIMLPLSMN